MAFKMKGSPAKLGTISGTAGHSSALKKRGDEIASALKYGGIDPDEIETGIKTDKEKEGEGESQDPVKIELEKKKKKKEQDKKWAAGDKKIGGGLNELVKARGKHKKGSPEYAAIQNKINEALGSKVRHKVEGSPEGTKKTVITDDKGTKDKSDDTTTTEDRVKGLGRKQGKTLTYTRKEIEKEKLAETKKDIEAAKETGDKEARDVAQAERYAIKSGRDDAKTGTKLSRWWYKQRGKVNKAQMERRAKKNEEKEA